MLTSWGAVIFAHRKLVLVLSALALIASIAVVGAVGGSLSSSGFIDDNSESARVDRQLAEEFGRGHSSLVFLIDASRPVTDPEVRTEIESALAPLAADERVARVITTWNSNNPRLVSTDGNSTYAVALLNLETEEAQEALDELEATVADHAAPGLTISTTGQPAVGQAAAEAAERGIARAESISVPLTLLIQLIVFGSLVAAGVPLLVGGLAIVGAMAVVFVISQFTYQSIFATNIITLLGLGLGIDYSLFMVARFREEMRRRPLADALTVTMGTVGKAILFSGITVIFALAATQFFPVAALRSMGLAGMIVVALALIYGLTFLPALLAMLGPRVNAIRIRIPGRQPGSTDQAQGQAAGESRFWHEIAQRVMARPIRVLVPVLAALLIASIPFLHLSLRAGGIEILPSDSEPRVVSDRLNAEFPADESDPIPVIVTPADGSPLSPASLDALRSLVQRAAEIPGVVRVDSIVSNEAAAFDWSGYSGDSAALPPELRSLTAETIRPEAALVQVVTNTDEGETERVTRQLRELEADGLDVAVGGDAASSMDTVDGIKAGLPPAVIFVVVGAYLILLMTFGSVFLPIKAIIMTLLSIGASLGAVVLVFQDGYLSSLLGFTATGRIDSIQPILTSAILFGLSMDYEVLMLARVQEEYRRTGNNTAAVAAGLERTAKMITGAAAIMVVVFGAFLLAEIVIIKSLGFGLALAVLIDATIVRALLVPATMRLMGHWNWWAPRPIQIAVARLGLAHA